MCNNTDGSFVCYCQDGYELDEDMRSCNGMFIACITESSWLCIYYGIIHCMLFVVIVTPDTDECATGQYVCGEYEVCVNEDKTYRCECAPGYVPNNGSCTGIYA